MPMCPVFNYPSHPLSLGYSEMPTNEPWENFKGLDAPLIKTQWKKLCISSGCKTWLEIGWEQNFPWGFSILKSLKDFAYLIKGLLSSCCQILPYRLCTLLSRYNSPYTLDTFWNNARWISFVQSWPSKSSSSVLDWWLRAGVGSGAFPESDLYHPHKWAKLPFEQISVTLLTGVPVRFILPLLSCLTRVRRSALQLP